MTAFDVEGILSCFEVVVFVVYMCCAGVLTFKFRSLSQRKSKEALIISRDDSQAGWLLQTGAARD